MESSLEMTTASLQNCTTPSHVAKKGIRFYMSYICICISAFNCAVDIVVLANALPVVAASLHGSTLLGYWCSIGFLCTQTIFQPMCGMLVNTFGSKSVMLFSLGLFVVTSVLCATAQRVPWLLATRAIQGIGAGGMNAVATIMVAEVSDLEDRGIYLGVMNLATSVGLISGVVLGAVFSELSTWRWIFWINLPISGIAIAGFIVFFDSPRIQRLPWRQSFRRMDWAGILVLTAALTSFLFAITTGGVLYPWGSAKVIAPLIIGIVGIVAFCVHEATTTKEPLIQMRVFASRTAAAGFFSSWTFGLVMWAVAYYLILYFLIAKNHSLVRSSIETLPGIGVIAPAAVVTGILVAVIHRFQKLLWLGWALITIGLGLLSTLTPASTPAEEFGYQVMIAVGGGIVFPIKIFAVQCAQKDKDVTTATAVVSFLNSLGEACGVAMGSAIFQSLWNEKINQEVASGVIPREYYIDASAILRESTSMNGLPERVQEVYRQAVASSIGKGIWTAMAALAGFAFLVSLMARNVRLDKPKVMENDHHSL